MSAFEVVIEKIIAGGDGLARHDGRIVFVPRTVAGEKHLVEVIEEKRDYLRAKSLKCILPSKDRRVAPCPYYARCGGCSLMHVSVKAQVDTKRGILIESLKRAGVNLTESTDVVVRQAPTTGYRNRLRFHIAHYPESFSMGFFRHSSHIVEDIDYCLLGSPLLNKRWQLVRMFFEENPEFARLVESIELQESSDNLHRVVARLFVRSGLQPENIDSHVVGQFLRDTGVHGVMIEGDTERQRKVHSGDCFVHHAVAGLKLKQSLGSFFQPNRFLVDQLLSSVEPEKSYPRGIDLYAGVGLFTIPLARRCRSVVSVETSISAVADGRANVENLCGSSVEFINLNAARFVKTFTFSKGDYVVVDPPRGGLPLTVRKLIASSPVQDICYVSCDPPALGRDVAFLQKSGFQIRKVDLFDFFPNTHHFETVVRLVSSTC